MSKRITIALAFLCAVAVSEAFPLDAGTDTMGVRIYFHQSKVELLPDYQKNGERLDSFINELHKVQTDPNYRFRSINIMGGASPEGTTRFNNWLSKQRADRITEYIQEHTLTPLNEDQITYEYPGVDWEGLKRYVLNDPDVPHREEVLYIIDHPGPGDDRVSRLKALKWNIPWQYLYKKYYPPLRASQVQIIFDRVFHLDSLKDATFRPLVLSTPVRPPEFHLTYGLKQMFPFYAGLKTNLVYDAALIPNIGLDVYMGRNWSAVVNWEYAWWKSDAVHWYWRAYGGDIEVRKWIGEKADEKPLTGHHVGPYFQILTYDFETGHRGYQGRRWTKAVGIAYGYSLPVRERLNIDFTIGIGYHWGQFYEYKPIDNHYVWQKTRNRMAITPTKVEVSLVWLIGHLNVNKDKEERRDNE
ncbi:MAG: DUF3575 domain-containing protein [Paramuribaculum sp.]|nr:DUF3575 domain-containing protein [Paramuribaculum sp.]MDE6459244.1 DUF3575 domain-containing protein [Paramuribaculum sp.]MDE6651690.1 DUF3575 domain-containing protein [Paramuribaculum sp.]